MLKKIESGSTIAQSHIFNILMEIQEKALASSLCE